MFQTPVYGLFSGLFKGSNHGSSYRGYNYIENDLSGNELAGVRVIGSRLYLPFNRFRFQNWIRTRKVAKLPINEHQMP